MLLATREDQRVTILSMSQTEIDRLEVILPRQANMEVNRVVTPPLSCACLRKLVLFRHLINLVTYVGKANG